MAQRVEVILEDDYDGGRADQTIEFALDGRTYEIDLSETNAASLRSTFTPWVTVARRVGRRRRASSRASAGSTQAIRAWAQENGIQIADRGRIPRDVQERYAQAVREVSP